MTLESMGIVSGVIMMLMNEPHERQDTVSPLR